MIFGPCRGTLYGVPKPNRISPAGAKHVAPDQSATYLHDSARLAAIVESSDDAIVSKTLEGIITSWNNGAERIFGYTAKEMIGRSITVLLPTERLAEEDSILNRLRNGERIDHFETVRLTKDGRRVDVTISVSPIRDSSGAIVGASKIARDVTERNAAQAAIMLAEQRLKMAAEAAKIGFWERDLVTGQLISSTESARIMGIAESERRPEDNALNIHPDDREMVRAKIDQAIQSRTSYELECRVIRPDSSICWVEGRGRAIYNSQDQAVRLLGTVVDISERKSNEDSARRRDVELAHLSRVSAMGNMASGLAHELNQPLGAILNYATVGQNLLRAKPVQAEKIQDVLESVMNETRRAGAIVSRVRVFVSKQTLKSLPVALNEMVDKAVHFVEFDMREQGVTVRVSPAKKEVWVLGDAIQIQQVLVNLMINAAQAMDHNHQADRSLVIEIQAVNERMARVSVIDNGPGMTAEQFSRLFEPFYTTKLQGLGLGLNISRSIVENHGGRLTAEANPAGGMRFSFTLPLKPE